MGIGVSGNYSQNNGSSQSTTNYNNTGVNTPNNLGYLQTGWNSAGTLLNSPWSSMVNNGMNLTSGAAPGATALATGAGGAAGSFANGNYVNNPANANLTPIANGSNIQSDPAFGQMMRTFANGAQAATDGAYGAAGRYGSGADANAFNSAVTNESGNLQYNNFQQQEQNQLEANQMLGNNDTAGRQQQLEGAQLTPSLIQSMFAPGANVSAAGYGPLQAYIQAITAGNAGGTQTNKGTSTTNGTTSGSQWGVNAQASGGTGMSGGL